LPEVAMFVNGWDKMSNRNRGLSIDTSYQVSVHLAKLSEEKNLKNQPISDPLTKCLPQAILVSNWSISKNLLL
jgi:hypothetical protein